MIKNLIVVAFRNIKRQKSFTVLHVLGLSLGMMSCLIVALYIQHEVSFDQFHEKADRIYRINQTFIWGDDDALFGSTGPAVSAAIGQEVPEFEAMTRVHTPGNFLIANDPSFGNSVFDESEILAVDENFFELFTFPLIAGNPETALSNPQSMIITEQTAKKYFGEQPALGKSLIMGEGSDKKSFFITGVASNIPSASHIQFDFLISMSSFPKVKKANDSWMWTTFVTFGLLREDANPAQVATKVARVPGKYLEDFLQKYRGISYQDFLASGEEWNLYMQPMLDIHLKSTNVYSRLNEIGDIKMIYILGLVAIFILILSLINFINLSTARASARAKEIGVRKVIGSSRGLLMSQFLIESLCYVGVAALIAMFSSELILPYINSIVGVELSLSSVFSFQTIAFTLLFVLLTALLGGVYPAFFMSSFKPVQALKGKGISSRQGASLRNGLVTIQFAISIGLLACTLIIQDQVSYWKNLDLGFERDNRVVIENVQRLGNSSEAFKNALLANPMVENITESSDTPPMIFDMDNFKTKGAEEKNISVNYLTTDESFLDVYGLTLLEGRNFRDGQQDSSQVIVNEQLIKSFGFGMKEEAIGKTINYYDTDFKIVGVVNDFQSLSDQTYPTAFFTENAPIFSDQHREITVAFNRPLESDEIVAFMSRIREEWAALGTGAPLEYTFLDEEYLRIFEDAIKFGAILQGLSLLAITIACLGLVGLLAYAIEKRNKEIVIRKVLGASISSIWLLLSGSFARYLALGFILAAPISWYLMQGWLDSYPVRKEISLLAIIGAGLVMMLMAILTMSLQTYRASHVNPVEYLKEE